VAPRHRLDRRSPTKTNLFVQRSCPLLLTHHGPERIFRQRPLQRLRFIPWRAHAWSEAPCKPRSRDEPSDDEGQVPHRHRIRSISCVSRWRDQFSPTSMRGVNTSHGIMASTSACLCLVNVRLMLVRPVGERICATIAAYLRKQFSGQSCTSASRPAGATTTSIAAALMSG